MNNGLRFVVETNVLVAASRSSEGLPCQRGSHVGEQAFEHVVTVPRVMEYEDVLLRPGVVPLPPQAVSDVLDFVCATAISASGCIFCGGHA